MNALEEKIRPEMRDLSDNGGKEFIDLLDQNKQKMRLFAQFSTKKGDKRMKKCRKLV